jgi:AcrR family transcriptional regulator
LSDPGIDQVRIAALEADPARKGRPRVGDPESISDLAARMFAQRGYEAVTMAQIASAAGVSTATLFRYFPSKADLLWHGMHDSVRLFREAFAERDRSSPLVDAVFEAYLGMLLASPLRLRVIKQRVAIVSRGEEMGEAAWVRFAEMSDTVSLLVAESRGIASDSLEARVAGGMIWGALWSAITAWSVSDEADPGPQVRAARRLMRSVT